MTPTPINLLLADDDIDDCNFFREALEELPISVKLTVVNDGVQLMQLLSENKKALPDALYLDLNMPRKNGLDCLAEIKDDEKLKRLPVIIFSTSYNMEIANHLYQNGANYYICKPAEFFNLKKIIMKSLELILETDKQQPSIEKFMLIPA